MQKNPTMQFLFNYTAYAYIYRYGFDYIYVYKYICSNYTVFMFLTSTVSGARTRYTVVGGGKEEMEGEETAAVHSSSCLTPIFYTDGMYPVTVSTI